MKTGASAPRAAIVSVRGTTVSLWTIAARSPGRRASRPWTPFGPRAHAAWRAAAVALPRCLPVLWRSVHDASRTLPAATFRSAWLAAPGFEERDAVLDGPSFGLAFFLLQASATLDMPLPSDVLATAALDEHGRTGHVDALPAKLRGIVESASDIRRVLVCASQREEAEEAAAGGLTIVAVNDAGQALRCVFGDALSARLVDAGGDPDARRDIVDAFFQLALVGRGAAVDWSPVERGAALALESWPLDPDARYRLTFARAVAARHENNTGEMPAPDADWLSLQPAPIRLALLTHLVQQSADTGAPSWRDAEALAAAHLPTGVSEAFVPHLKLMGALARLQAVTGREREALNRQRELAETFASIYADAETSFPLSEWFRLAGVLADAAAFEDAERFRRRMQARDGFGWHGAPYVELARARALVLLARTSEAVDPLATLEADAALPLHVRWSAARWLVAAHRSCGRPADAERALERLQRAADVGTIPARYLTLARLDEAIVADADAGDLVERLAALDPGPTRCLQSVSRDAAFIARAYPY